MTAADDYPDPFSPDDPRHRDWLIVRGFIQHEESAARAELLSALEKTRSLQASDIVNAVERSFGAYATGIMVTVNSTRSAQSVSTAFDELLKQMVARYIPLFREAGKVCGVDATCLQQEVELRLNVRVQELKAQAFRFGVNCENARRKQGPLYSGSSTPEQSVVGRNISRLRKECGWSYNELEKQTGLDKKLILGHVNGKGLQPKSLLLYAQAFTRRLGRTILVAELENSNP